MQMSPNRLNFIDRLFKWNGENSDLMNIKFMQDSIWLNGMIMLSVRNDISFLESVWFFPVCNLSIWCD